MWRVKLFLLVATNLLDLREVNIAKQTICNLNNLLNLEHYWILIKVSKNLNLESYCKRNVWNSAIETIFVLSSTIIGGIIQNKNLFCFLFLPTSTCSFKQCSQCLLFVLPTNIVTVLSRTSALSIPIKTEDLWRLKLKPDFDSFYTVNCFLILDATKVKTE